MTRLRMSRYQTGPPHGREHEDRDHQHDEQERRPAAQVQGLVLLDVGHRELLAVLERVDAHVLGAVVLEHAAQVLDLGDDGEVGEEDADAHEALDHPEQEALAEPALHEAGEEQRRDEEQADGEGEGDDERDADLLLAQLLLLLAQRLVGRDRERADADGERLDQGDDAAQDRQLEDRVALHPAHERPVVEADGLVRTAHGERPPVDAAHHDALDDGLPADLRATRGQGGQEEGDEGEASGHVREA